ncbi:MULTISPECIES: hypothetical protein [unclassified Streptomyces]|uniref:hypothetical protein n=1 Tax=unclassified Streptomyces TaxID=2593676 RepID=UPI003BB7F7A8
MDAALTAAAFLVLVTIAVYVIHRLDNQHAERIALRTYSRPLRGLGTPAERAHTGAPPVRPAVPPVPADRHDHRDGGRGRLPARRRRDRTTHKRAR